MQSKPLIVLLVISAIAVFIASCSESEPPNALTVLQDVPPPNHDAMEVDVATLLDNSWNELQNDLKENESEPILKADAYANYGLIAFGNGLVLPAELAFQNATILAPNDARWVYFTALMHEYTGKLEQAVSSFERVLVLRPDDLPTLLRLGNVRFEQARMDDARVLYQRALDLDAESAAAHYRLGRVASADSNHLDAIKYFEKALELQPYADQINYLLGLSWRNLGDRNKAKAYLAKRGTNEPHFSDPLFDKISGGKARIGGLWAHMNAGSQAFVDGNFKVAVDEFRQATQDHPDDSRSWQSLGMGLKNTGENENALIAYRKTLEISNDNSVVHHELAKLLIVTNDLEEAERHLTKALAIDSRMIEAYRTLARLLINTGRTEEALERYNDAIELDSQSTELIIFRAETLVALDRSNEAVKTLAEAVQINSLDTDLRIAYGLTLVDDGQSDKAMSEIMQALDDSKDDSSQGRAHYAIGRVHLKKGDGHAAISSFGEALKINPKHRAAALELARTFLRVRDFNQSLGVYEVLIQHWPDNDGIRVEAARVALQLGDGTKARRILEAGVAKQSASARLHGSYARLLVLSTQPDVGDTQLALNHAQIALKLNQASQHSETLALCYAGLGQFDGAEKLQQSLMKNTGAKSTEKVRSRMEKNLERYRSRRLGRLPFDAS